MAFLCFFFYIPHIYWFHIIQAQLAFSSKLSSSNDIYKLFNCVVHCRENVSEKLNKMCRLQKKNQ